MEIKSPGFPVLSSDILMKMSDLLFFACIWGKIYKRELFRKDLIRNLSESTQQNLKMSLQGTICVWSVMVNTDHNFNVWLVQNLRSFMISKVKVIMHTFICTYTGHMKLTAVRLYWRYMYIGSGFADFLFYFMFCVYCIPCVHCIFCLNCLSVFR